MSPRKRIPNTILPLTSLPISSSSFPKSSLNVVAHLWRRFFIFFMPPILHGLAVLLVFSRRNMTSIIKNSWKNPPKIDIMADITILWSLPMKTLFRVTIAVILTLTLATCATAQTTTTSDGGVTLTVNGTNGKVSHGAHGEKNAEDTEEA